MRTSRRILLAGGASVYAAIGHFRFPAGAAEFSYKLGSGEDPAHPHAIRTQQACDKVTAESGGRLEVKFFPNGILGSDTTMLTQVRLGALELQSIGDNILTTVVPLAAISTIPFAFGGYQDAWRTMDGPLGAYVRTAISKANFYAFEKKWDSGMRQLINNFRPIFTPDDLKGLKMRVPVAPITIALFRALGASPTPINGREIYTALQTHLVDGFEQPLISLEADKFYEVSKYVSIANHMWTGYNVIANVDAWQRLPANLRDVMERNFDAFAVLERGDIMRQDNSLTATLKGQGLLFNQANVGTFKAAIRRSGLYLQWRDSFGADAWALLEKSVGRLA
jgi:TRAP-type transport system periplasmic protein